MALLLALAAAGCSTDAVDVDGCKQIEEARCRQAPACGLALSVPNFTSGTDVDACIRFYDDACLHGLAVSDPGPAAISACVTAIQSTSTKDHCAVVQAPQTDTAACGWLVPATATVDASDAQEAVDAADAAAE
jgi:hypothetical protein